MYSSFAKERFLSLQGSDVDYLIISKNAFGKECWSAVPSLLEDIWETIDEAIEWHFKMCYDEIEIYNLYSPFETSLIRCIGKKNIPETILTGDIVDFSDVLP